MIGSKIKFSLLLATTMLLVPGHSFAQQAPDWTLSRADGQTITLSELRGQPVLLHFWATWCPYCKRVQPGLNRLYNEYRDEGVEVIGVSFREDAGADPQGVLDERGIDFPTVINGDDVAASYGVKGTPTNIFIGRDGSIRETIADSDPENPAFEAALLDILAVD